MTWLETPPKIKPANEDVRHGVEERKGARGAG
jgi:hypothetical protein